MRFANSARIFVFLLAVALFSTPALAQLESPTATRPGRARP